MQALLIETGAGAVVIPVSTVAHIISAVEIEPSRYRHDAILGDFIWRDFNMPLVDSTSVLGTGVDGDDGYERAVILWPMKDCKETEFFALTCKGAPRVVDESVLTAPGSADVAAPRDNVLGYIQVETEVALVPDLGKIARDLFENQ